MLRRDSFIALRIQAAASHSKIHLNAGSALNIGWCLYGLQSALGEVDGDQGCGLGRERPRADEARSCAPSIPTACTRRSPPRWRGQEHRGPPTATLQEPEHGLTDERLAPTDVLLWWGHAAHGEVEDAVVERVAAARLGRHGADRPAFRPLLEDLQAADGHALLAEMARGGRARAHLGRSTAAIRSPQGLGECIEIAQHRDVWRAVRRAGAAGDGVHLLVRGRRGVPLRPDLPARRRQHLLFPPGPRDLSDLPPRRTCGRCCATPCTGRTTRAGLDGASTRRRTCRSARPRRRSSRRAPRLHADGDSRACARRMHRLLLLGTGGIAGHHVAGIRGDPGMPDRRLRRPRARPRRGLRRSERHRAAPSKASTRRSPGASSTPPSTPRPTACTCRPRWR